MPVDTPNLVPRASNHEQDAECQNHPMELQTSVSGNGIVSVEQAQAQTQLAISPTPPPPDGGLRAWSQVFAGHLINCLTWGFGASFGVYQLHYTEALSLPPSQISWVGSIQIFLTFAISAFSGRLADAGYARHAVLAGTILCVVGTFMTSLAVTYWQILLAQGICTGIGMGVMYMPAVTVVGTYFARKRTMALAMSAAGGGTGSVVFPAIVQYLTPQIGFPWAVRSAGFVALCFSILINILLRPRLPPRKAGPIIEWAAFREPPYVLFAIGMFLIFWALYFVYFYINTFARKVIGFDDLASVNLLLILNAVGVPTRPALGYVSDRWCGPINLFIPLSAMLGLMVYCWMAVTTPGGLYAFAVVYGLVTAAVQGIFVGALASLTKDLSKMGTRFGMVFSILAFATLMGPPISGALIEKDGGGYKTAQAWGGTVIILGSLTVGAARLSETGLRVKIKM